MVVSATAESPCKDCPERKLHCHSECGKYRQYKEQLEINRTDIKAKVDEAYFLRDEKYKIGKHYQKRRKDGIK